MANHPAAAIACALMAALLFAIAAVARQQAAEAVPSRSVAAADPAARPTLVDGHPR